ncbi:possible catalase [Aurantimonas manganoxydans SI85-9A1]|uniref:catalase n=2 Tax=Aurantimonas manganoxydans TaxID=651183 RepID=Q1YER7_AURMS|nr:possible catalase [Aurantimonas manganoxydans SI85-9A1]
MLRWRGHDGSVDHCVEHRQDLQDPVAASRPSLGSPMLTAAEDDSRLAEKLVEALYRPDGSRALRPVHALGIGATGTFVASRIASDFCVAEHFSGEPITTTVRFSNGSGCATAHDGWSDVRGMATRFHLADAAATDLVAMTLPEFFTATPEAFLDFAAAARPAPYKGESVWRKLRALLRLELPLRNPYPGETISPDSGAIAFADVHPNARLAVFGAAAIGAPLSYVRASYHAVHTFVVTGKDGTRRHVRFSWQPIAGVANTNKSETPVDSYLLAELRTRLEKGSDRFSLVMTIGETGDAFDDPTRPWPPHRVRIVMGTMTIEAVADDQAEASERLSFNPWLLVHGMEASDDPVLRVRKEAYKISSARRGGAPCPFAGG